jgi:iron complex transport system substrate-binding protein
LQESIVGVDNDKYFNDPVMLERLRKGEVGIMGEEGQMQAEKIVSINPGVLVASSYGFNNTALKSRLKQLNIQVLMCDNFKEQHPLARAEWIKFFGFIYGRPSQADSLFAVVEKNYLQVKDSAKLIKQKPRIMTEAMYSEVWSIPGGNSYTSRLIEDAGGEYIYSYRKDLYTYPLNLESVLKESGNADIWIHVNQFKSKARMLEVNPRYALFRPFQTNRIYNNNKRENAYGGNDFWETGAFRADMVLRDLMTIFSGEKISEDKLYFYTLVD